jgi:hypothetical protein
LLQHFPASLVFAAVGGEAGVPPVVSTEQDLLCYQTGLQQFTPLLTHRELDVAAGGFRCLFQDEEYIWLKANFKLLRVHRQTRAIEDYTPGWRAAKRSTCTRCIATPPATAG